jgi:hypothetical protein
VCARIICLARLHSNSMKVFEDKEAYWHFVPMRYVRMVMMSEGAQNKCGYARAVNQRCVLT